MSIFDIRTNVIISKDFIADLQNFAKIIWYAFTYTGVGLDISKGNRWNVSDRLRSDNLVWFGTSRGKGKLVGLSAGYMSKECRQ